MAAVHFFEVSKLEPAHWMSMRLHALLQGSLPSFTGDVPPTRRPLPFVLKLRREVGSRVPVTAKELLLGPCGCIVVRVDTASAPIQRLHFVALDGSVSPDDIVALVRQPSAVVHRNDFRPSFLFPFLSFPHKPSISSHSSLVPTLWLLAW